MEKSENTMTLHKALGELKTLEERIKKEIDRSAFIAYCKVSIGKIDNMTKEEYSEKVIVSSFDKVNALIERRRLIKDALTKKNAEVEFKIGNRELTIATAIDLKNSIQNEKKFLSQLAHQYNNVIGSVHNNNNNLDDKALSEAQKFFENKDQIDTKKLENIKQQYIDERKLEVVDPLGLRVKIEGMEEDIMTFEREIDYKLSELNATTVISI